MSDADPDPDLDPDPDPDPDLDLDLAGLAMLLLDVLAGDEGELELLAHYARAPEQLSAAQRSHLELRIAESPAVADQLRVLRTLACGAWARDGGEPPLDGA